VEEDGTDSFTDSVIVSGNNIFDCTFGNGIRCNMYTNNSDDEGTLITSNVLHDNASTGSITGISVLDNGANISGNIINDLTTSSSSTVTGIQANCTSAIINGNVIKNLSGTGTIYGIDNYGSNVITNNLCHFSANSSSNIYGIYNQNWVTGTNGLIANNNRLRINNPGSGVGYAFYINVSAGVAIGNSYLGSDALGTLTMTGGEVSHNDG